MPKHPSLLISLSDVRKNVGHQKQGSSILKNINLDLYEGESCVIQGESGAGKSTLLNLLGLLDLPTSGDFYFQGVNLTLLSLNEISNFRNSKIGFVFQGFNLLPSISALDNVALPLLYRGIKRQMSRDLAKTQLSQLGLEELSHRFPADLSGGQQQRVAIARALITQPLLILADEPTGNLDDKSAAVVFDLLLSLNTRYQTTLVVVTHNFLLAALFNRKIYVRDGSLVETE